MIAVADPVKKTSAEAIREMEQMGLDVVMLTGDHEKTARAIQKQLGISRVIAQVLPQDKEREVRRLQEEGHKVAMVGDGINDAPALARADVGIAIGAGTDVAIESADIVLMKSDLLDAVTAVQLSRAVIRNIKENLFWAFCYNAIGIPLAAGVFYPLLNWQLSPMFGSAAMSFSSVFVVCNALRLKGFQSSFRKKHRGQESRKETDRTEDIQIKAETTAPQQTAEQAEKKGDTTTMKKTIKIEGMMCSHCTGRVDKALNALDGVTATVSLEDKAAYVTVDGAGTDESSNLLGSQGGRCMQADRKKIERLLKTARGQIDGILRMVEEDRYCMDISAQVTATEAILKKVNNEVIRAHMKGCMKTAILEGNGDEKIDELMSVVDKMSK